MGRERRRRNRRSTTSPAAGTPSDVGAGVEGGVPDGAARVPGRSLRARAAGEPVRQVRSDRVIERESTMMVTEMKRVGVVSAVCFGMLAVLVIVDRLQ